MNFFNPYEIPRGTTPNPTGEQDETPAPTAPEQSLNEEVAQVIGQLGRFWGGFRKQSQAAIESAKKDLNQVVSQAQKELGKLTSIEDAAVESSGEPTTPGSSSKATVQSAPEDAAQSSSPSEEVDTPNPSSPNVPKPEQAIPESSTSSNHSLFSRIQSTLPPNIASTLQSNLQNISNLGHNIPSSLRDAYRDASSGVSNPSSIDLNQLRSTLTNEFQRVQGVTRAQAEEYVKKSEALLKDAGDYLKDAVKVVPPEEGVDDDASRGVDAGNPLSSPSADGFFMSPFYFPSVGVGVGAGTGAKRKGKGKQGSGSGSHHSHSTLRAAATRADALLQRLNRDPEMIKIAPDAEGTDENAKAMYAKWASTVGSEGGISGEKWKPRSEKTLEAEAGLRTTKEALVPNTLSEETFWTHYFYRRHQIEQEEERRKALLSAGTADDEDFSWEDEEEADTPATSASQETATVQSPAPSPSPTPANNARSSNETLAATATNNDAERPTLATSSSVLSMPNSSVAPSATASPRLSSEDSYDVVSQVSENGASEKAKKAKEEAVEEDGDSDWE